MMRNFMRNILKKIFESSGHEVVGEADTADNGVQSYKKLKPDIVTMDICMPNKSGIEAIKDIIQFDDAANISCLQCTGPRIACYGSNPSGCKGFHSQTL